MTFTPRGHEVHAHQVADTAVALLLCEALHGHPGDVWKQWLETWEGAVQPSSNAFASGPHAWVAVVQEQQGLRADAYTYSLLMNGFAHARRPDMAFKLVRWLLAACTLAQRMLVWRCFTPMLSAFRRCLQRACVILNSMYALARRGTAVDQSSAQNVEVWTVRCSSTRCVNEKSGRMCTSTMRSSRRRHPLGTWCR